ncbi:pentatricopeptide repeat-containing protein At1g02150-like [Corylus avellana]|uniref:pentatricopeptide repeat-containing protein At1g02150-like n=1 Tax=Corylus avellana TaxID=13451 RepID=UPI00286C1247|nr:pentatricopeptide repeat-containing protein At1g02150-like [Corylus avellana]XP_059432092.1 pentatricopeptide repeat-containing protein At1g02150-like [Corylus avellana]
MLLQSSLHHHNVSLSSSLSYARPLPCRVPSLALPKTANYRGVPITVTCSISQIHSYGTVDYERRPMVKWNAIYKRISLMENPELGSGSVLNQWEKEGRKLSKWELCRVVKELRKFKRYKHALEVYDWMNDRGERFRLSASDAAIQLDLIGKVRGISGAEEYFLMLPDALRDRRIYGALLNAYVRSKMRDKAESLLDKMKSKGYATHSLPFNVMMTLYMNLNEYDKVDSIISEMMEKSIQLDIYSYNIWLSSRGSQGSAEKMEQVFEQMKQDRTINPNWTTFSTMATMYIKMGQFEKAEDCLKKVESRITGRDRIPYHYLISLYGNVGNKEEAYRVWKVYRAVFPSIPNLGYHAIISSLVRLGDIERAEKVYEEWLQVKSSYDPRIGNLLMGWYVKEGNLDKAESFFNNMLETGGKPNSSTWETLVEGHMGERRISEALSCWKEAFIAEGSKSWRPKPSNVSTFFKLCEEKDDVESREVLVGLLMQSRHLEDEAYASRIALTNGDIPGNELSAGKDRVLDKNDNNEDENDGSELLNQLQGSL